MKKRYVNLILAMVSASAMALGSVPAMAATDSAKTESAKNDSKEDAEASNEKEADAAKTDTLEDGVYTAEFDTDSSMFHVNEANDKKGELTVKDGKMTIHVSLVSKIFVIHNPVRINISPFDNHQLRRNTQAVIYCESNASPLITNHIKEAGGAAEEVVDVIKC